jgi:hypothetical protein
MCPAAARVSVRGSPSIGSRRSIRGDADVFADEWSEQGASPGAAPSDGRRLDEGQTAQDVAGPAPAKLVRVVQQVEGGERLRRELIVGRERPQPVDTAHQHGGYGSRRRGF